MLSRNGVESSKRYLRKRTKQRRIGVPESLEDRQMLAAAPVLAVTTQGLVEAREAVGELADALQIGKYSLTDYGTFLFADEDRFGALPTKNERVDDSQNEDDARAIAEELDFDAIAKIVAPERDEATKSFLTALDRSGAHPTDLLFKNNELFDVGFRSEHSTFAAFDVEGQDLIKEKAMDTRVSAELSFDNIRVVGPGAKLTATYDQAGVNQLRYAMRGLAVGDSVDIISSEEATEACVKLQSQAADNMQTADLDTLAVDVEQIYYAPDLHMTEVQMLVPHYRCEGTVMNGKEEVIMLEQFIPAATSAEMVPQVSVDVESERSQILATINIKGGQAPYQIYLGSAGGTPIVEGTTENSTKVEWTYVGRQEGLVSDDLVVTVVDGNGLQVTTSQGFSVELLPQPIPGDVNGDRTVDFSDFLILSKNFNQIVEPGTGGDFDGDGIVKFNDFLILSANFGVSDDVTAEGNSVQPVVGGTRDYGIEIPAMEFGNLAQGFANRMSDDGVVRRFFWQGNNAWENDFHSPNDSAWIDNTDITLYTGHGSSTGFSFTNSTQSDSRIDTNDAEVSAGGDWGDNDLEWLALYSCQVLRFTPDAQSLIRWTQEFDGLHMLLGFHTNARANMNFTGEFADNMVRSPFLWWNDPMPVRVAWFDAVDSHQPSGRRAVAMGPIRNDNVSNVNDYFHGKGSVGPDIRNDILGYWVHSFTS